MTIQQLEYMKTLAETGSFSQTARRHGVTQSAISQQVSRLEKEVNFAVFDRVNAKLGLTDRGKKFYERVLILLAEFRQLTEFAGDLEDRLQGHLEVGIIPTLSPYLSPLFSRVVESRYPMISLNIKELISEQIVAQIKTGEISCGIIAMPYPLGGPSITEMELFFEEIFLYTSPDSDLVDREIVSTKDINGHHLWLLNEGNCFRDQINNICDVDTRHPEWKLDYHSNSIDSLIRIVDAQGGLTFIPELSTIGVPETREDLIKAVEDETRYVRKVSLLHLKRHHETALIEKLGECVRDSVPKRMHNLGGRTVVDTNPEGH